MLIQNACVSAQKNPSAEKLDDASDANLTAIQIEGMDCAYCAARVRDALTALDGVVSAAVDWQQGLAIVDYIPEKTNGDALVCAVAGAGENGRQCYRAKIIASKENVQVR